MMAQRSPVGDNSQIGSGHMGATPQPKRTVFSHGNQHRRSRKPGITNVSECNQLSGESIDTVGVTGSIPVSPTPGRHETGRHGTWRYENSI
jgi:hypothetical protein